jgi:DNA-directed RNA polymerase alpha subunit
LKEYTKKERMQHKAILSNDPNRILLAFDRRVATALFYAGINAKKAIKMSGKELLKLHGIGPASVKSIKRTADTVHYHSKKTDRFVSPFE